MANRTILIVDDNPSVLEYYFNIFEADDFSALDILGEQKAVRRWHPTFRQQDPRKFDEMFEGMVRNGTFHPLCVVDLHMPGPDGQMDPRRGLTTARRVRELDARIHIVFCTADPDIDGAEIIPQVGGSTHFFRRPFKDNEEQQFCATVRDLIDAWNAEDADGVRS